MALLTKVPVVVSRQLNLATDPEVRPMIYSWEDQVLSVPAFSPLYKERESQESLLADFGSVK